MVAAYGDHLHSPSLFLYYLGGSQYQELMTNDDTSLV
jgi:hypothetical protein